MGEGGYCHKDAFIILGITPKSTPWSFLMGTLLPKVVSNSSSALQNKHPEFELTRTRVVINAERRFDKPDLELDWFGETYLSRREILPKIFLVFQQLITRVVVVNVGRAQGRKRGKHPFHPLKKWKKKKRKKKQKEGEENKAGQFSGNPWYFLFTATFFVAFWVYKTPSLLLAPL